MERFSVATLLNNRYKIISTYKIESGAILYIAEDIRFIGEKWLVHQIDISENINSRPYVNNLLSLLSLLSKIIYDKIGKIVDYFIEKSYLIVISEDVPGIKLSEIIYTTTPNTTKIVKLGLQLLEITKFLYSKNIINFVDLNPENIIIDKHGIARIQSFAISKLPTLITDKGIEDNKFVGTLGYIPPEMIDDEPSNIKEHTYIYIIASIMYEYLTKIGPYSREDPFFFPPISSFSPTVSSNLSSLIEKCLNYTPANRIKTFNEFEKKLLQILKNETDTTETMGKSTLFSFAKNQSLIIILIIIFLQLFMILAFFIYYLLIL